MGLWRIDPEQMKNVCKGDQVEVVYTKAVAISVTPSMNKQPIDKSASFNRSTDTMAWF
jgi:hypothetical protein